MDAHVDQPYKGFHDTGEWREIRDSNMPLHKAINNPMYPGAYVRLFPPRRGGS